VSEAGLIEVDFVGQAAHGLPGRLGLTSAPGCWRPGRDSGSDRLLEDDMRRLRDHYRARVLVTLLEDSEMLRLSVPVLRGAAGKEGLESLWFPIADLSAPANVEATSVLVDRILGHLSRGDTVVVHCRAGLGRSGTVAACCLVARGRRADTAIRLVRAARPGAVEADAQARFVARFARARVLGR